MQMVRKTIFFDCISRLKGKVASQDRFNKETADKFIDYFSTVGKTLASNFESKIDISKSISISVQSMRLTRATSLEVREIINKMRTKYSTDCFELNNLFFQETRMGNCANTNKINQQMYR